MNRTRTGFSLAALAAVILLLFQIAPSALAQDQDDQDPPTRAGRLGYVHGTVSFQPGGQGDWLDAVANRPLTTGDNLWADSGARAEVQIGSSSIRLNSETSVTLLALEDNTTQLRLSLGTIFFRVRHLREGETFEVDTPNLAFNIYQPGEYRLDVNQNGDQTIAAVFRGDAEITGGGSSYRLQEGQQGTFSGVEQLAYDIGGINDNDDFTRWCRSRDERADRVRSRQYVSDDMTGYEDLDDYGRWREVPEYGAVWTPVDVPYGWAPYRYGHWAYVGPWGWTWVEDEPWGFAPFHYGRWAFVGGGWCWVPGPVAVVPVYSPALVVFVGGGVGFGAGVGWFPLAPGEVYVPWYRTSPRYVQNVNITNTRVTNIQVTNVYNNVTVNHVTNTTYVNQRVNNSVTVVNRDTFVNARSVRNNIVRVDQRQITQAPVTHEVAREIQPQRQSVMGAGRPARVAPPQQALARSVVATHQPVVPNRPAPPVAGLSRPTPQAVRTVQAAPPAQAQPLQRGARGTTQGGNAPANAGRPTPPPAGGVQRPGAPENEGRPGAPENAARPGAPENNRGAMPSPRPEAPTNAGPGNQQRPGMQNNNVPRSGNVPRPAAPENGNAQPGATARPENAPAQRQGFPRPGGQDNNPPTGRANAPENAPPSRNVPRPPSAEQTRPGQLPEQQRGNPEAARPQPTRPESPRTMPEEPARPEGRPQSAPPDNRPAPPDNRPAPPQSRRDTAPPDSQRQSAPPENRHIDTPPPMNREESAPRPQTRTEPAPRPEARPAEPPPQRESRPAESRNERSNPPEKNNKENSKEKEKDKEPPKSKFR
jgi:hypothetical protein